MAMTLNQLQSQLSGLNQYQSESEESIRKRAEDAYKPQYEQSVANLRDQLDTQLATQARSALSNGMQRSSYNQAAQASIQGSALRSQAELEANYNSGVAQLFNQLLEADKDRKTAADQQRDNLLLQIYQLGKSSGSSGSGNKSGGNGTTDPNANLTSPNGDKTGADSSLSFLDSLYGNSTNASSGSSTAKYTMKIGNSTAPTKLGQLADTIKTYSSATTAATPSNLKINSALSKALKK